MAKPLRLKQHDLQPYYRFGVRDSDGNPVDCTGATAVFTMKAVGSSTPVINRAACVWTNEANGDGEYRWVAGDTDATGRFAVEIEITPQTGGKFTLPASGTAYVIIEADMDGV